MMTKNYVLLLGIAFFWACASPKPVVTNNQKAVDPPKDNKIAEKRDSLPTTPTLPTRKAEDYVKTERVFVDSILKIKEYEKSFTGICIYDLDSQKYVVQHQAQRYFMPASTTKLLTFYAAIKMLGDSVPALQYLQNKDSLVVWGTANPTFLHPSLPDSAAYHFLKKTKQKIYFSPKNFTEPHFGVGWAWDDYSAYYSAEKSAFPIHGNLILFTGKDKTVKATPSFFQKFLQKNEKIKTESWYLTRKPENNDFIYAIGNLPKAQSLYFPFKVSNDITTGFLSDFLGKKVSLLDRPIYPTEKVQTLYSYRTDTLYRLMMQESDNFLAEHTLLMCAQSIPQGNRNVNAQNVISYVSKNYLADLPDAPRWVDGSGLSRYNLITPRSMVALLVKIREEFLKKPQGEKSLFETLPTGGKTGTLRNIAIYKQNPPFIFAKTGTLSNNHNLCGYLITKSGRKLCFAFMNNNYMEANATIRNRMAQILTDFYLYY